MQVSLVRRGDGEAEGVCLCGQLLAREGVGPAAVGVYACGGGLKAVHLAAQISDGAGHDVLAVLGGSAVGGTVHGGYGFALVEYVDAGGGIHGGVGGACRAVQAAVDLTVRVVGDVKAVIVVGVEVAGGIGAGAEGLGLERLDGPAAAHLVGQDALDVVLDIDDVDDRQLFAAAADVLKVAVILIALEPGHGLAGAALRADGEVLVPAAVELKEDGAVRRAAHGDAVLRGGIHRAAHAVPAHRGLRLGDAREAADEGVILSVVIRREAAVLCGGRGGLLKAVIGAGEHDVVAAEAGAAAYGNVFVHRHGDLSLVGVADLVEDAARVIPAEEIAIADLVFEVGGLQGAVADAAGAVIVVEADADLGIREADAARHGEVRGRGRGLVPARALRAGGAAAPTAYGRDAVRRHDVGVARDEARAARAHGVGGAEAAGEHVIGPVDVDIPRRRGRQRRKKPRYQQQGEDKGWYGF